MSSVTVPSMSFSSDTEPDLVIVCPAASAAIKAKVALFLQEHQIFHLLYGLSSAEVTLAQCTSSAAPPPGPSAALPATPGRAFVSPNSTPAVTPGSPASPATPPPVYTQRASPPPLYKWSSEPVRPFAPSAATHAQGSPILRSAPRLPAHTAAQETMAPTPLYNELGTASAAPHAQVGPQGGAPPPTQAPNVYYNAWDGPRGQTTMPAAPMPGGVAFPHGQASNGQAGARMVAALLPLPHPPHVSTVKVAHFRDYASGDLVLVNRTLYNARKNGTTMYLEGPGSQSACQINSATKIIINGNSKVRAHDVSREVQQLILQRA